MSLCINPECPKPQNSDTTIFCMGCGSELLLDGRYRVVRELGHGGFGTTYEIIDVNSRSWLLKVLTDNHPKYVELFQQEARILGVFNHPGIPKIDLDGYFLYFANQQQEPLHCLVMEKIEGLNLHEYIHQRGNRPVKPKRVLRWLAELTLILEQVHDRNFFHRDIKPANIMLRSNGCLVLIDFGTARKVDQSYIAKQALGQITGVVTQGYTPIEQMRGKAVLQSDFYSLSGTMIFLLTAKNPTYFYNFSQNRLDWQQAVEGVSPQFADLLNRMMAFCPSQRPSTAREIFNQIIALEPSLQILDEHFKSSSSEPKPTSIVKQNSISTSSLNNSPIAPEFVKRCCQELAEFIGPIATIVCDRIIKQNPTISQEELCLALAKTINNPEQARDFQQRFL
ncbi:serine/threonine-protein kinase [Pleurocapsa sp. PCC 7319]|uniref:serine/threonine-protein kinase n=1 Tax=Pleurocapsa sp. PCC 7319 TaxID=118161 RepID=UPI0003459D85|nr:serine/threonine-protein kinase [Pleurocapsa sp. PCC 7319]